MLESATTSNDKEPCSRMPCLLSSQQLLTSVYLCRLHNTSNALQQPLASLPPNPTPGKPRRVNGKHSYGYICLISGKAFDNFCQSHFALKGENISPCFLKCHDFLVVNNIASLIAYIFKHQIQGSSTSPSLIFCGG